MRIKLRPVVPKERVRGDTKTVKRFALWPRKIQGHLVWLEHFTVVLEWERRSYPDCKHYLCTGKRASEISAATGSGRRGIHLKYCGYWAVKTRKLLPEVPEAKALKGKEKTNDSR